MNHVVMTKFVPYGGPPSSQVWPQIILLLWFSLKKDNYDFYAIYSTSLFLCNLTMYTKLNIYVVNVLS